MPGRLVPHRSGAHKIACLSLYRALLKQCAALKSTVETGTDISKTLKSLVIYRFHKDKKIQSLSKIANGLQAGSYYLDLLRACRTGSATAFSELTRILSSVAQLADETALSRARQRDAWTPPDPILARRLDDQKAKKLKSNHVRHPSSTPILSRPLPLSEIPGGKRIVPAFMVSQTFPFLRYSKPQPISLSRMLRQRIKWVDARYSEVKEMEQQMAIASLEDEWDLIIKSSFAVGDSDDSTYDQYTSRPSGLGSASYWVEAPRNAKYDLFARIDRNARKQADMGRRMWEIVQKEKALAEQEKEDTGTLTSDKKELNGSDRSIK